MSNWAAVSDVQARLTYETISASSNPTTTEVQAWLDEGEAFIVLELRAAGIATTYTDTDTTNVLTSYAADYATGHTKRAWASAAGNSDNEDGQIELDRFEAFLERVRNNPIAFGEALSASGSVADSIQHARSYTTDNPDSKTVANGDFAAVVTVDETF